MRKQEQDDWPARGARLQRHVTRNGAENDRSVRDMADRARGASGEAGERECETFEKLEANFRAI